LQEAYGTHVFLVVFVHKKNTLLLFLTKKKQIDFCSPAFQRFVSFDQYRAAFSAHTVNYFTSVTRDILGFFCKAWWFLIARAFRGLLDSASKSAALRHWVTILVRLGKTEMRLPVSIGQAFSAHLRSKTRGRVISTQGKIRALRSLGLHRAALALTCAILATPPARADTAVHFDLNEIRVEGSTVLPQDEVEEAVYPFLGPDKTAQDVEKARAALEDLYQKRGFVTVSVSIPTQHISTSGGVVYLQAIERPVGRLRVVGARYFLPSDIRNAAPALAPGTVPNIHTVSRDLIALNTFSDRQVQPNLKAGRRPDTVDADLDVTDTFPLHGSLELNNRYNADTTHLRLAASLSYDNFFQRGDVGNVAYQVAPENVADAEVTSASYLFHIPSSQLSVLFSYLHSNSNVTALSTTDVVGRGTTAGFRVLVPLGSTANFSHSLSVGWDYKRYFELDTFKTTDTKTYAPITFYPLTSTYSASWTADKSQTDLSIGLEFGLSAFGSDYAAFFNKAANAAPGYSIARASVSRQQDLPYGMQAYASVTGQLSNDSLVSSEQLPMGGADSIRGYLEAETIGDTGAYLQSELRSPDLKKYINKYLGGSLRSLRFHTFYDGGVVSVNYAAEGTHSQYGLQSAGIGARVNLWGYLNGVLQDATTLNRGPDTPPGTNRVLFRLYGEF
jgi:hemolysin activation/secretion protein